MNIEIMRAFVRIKKLLTFNKDFAIKMEALERKVNAHDLDIRTVFEAIRKMMEIPQKPIRKIGFHE